MVSWLADSVCLTYGYTLTCLHARTLPPPILTPARTHSRDYGIYHIRNESISANFFTHERDYIVYHMC
jgi:hypothetical protein